MAEITIDELGPGVILEHTTADGERYQYKAPEQVKKYLPEIKVFREDGGNNAER